MLFFNHKEGHWKGGLKENIDAFPSVTHNVTQYSSSGTDCAELGNKFSYQLFSWVHNHQVWESNNTLGRCSQFSWGENKIEQNMKYANKLLLDQSSPSYRLHLIGFQQWEEGLFLKTTFYWEAAFLWTFCRSLGIVFSRVIKWFLSFLWFPRISQGLMVSGGPFVVQELNIREDVHTTYNCQLYMFFLFWGGWSEVWGEDEKRNKYVYFRFEGTNNVYFHFHFEDRKQTMCTLTARPEPFLLQLDGEICRTTSLHHNELIIICVYR